MKRTINQLKQDFPGMDARHVQRLTDLGFRNGSHVEDVARGHPDSNKLIAACLEVDQDALLRALGWSRWPEHCGVSLSCPCPLGGVLAPENGHDATPRGSIGIATRRRIPDHASLTKRFQDARDQLAVGTCTAFGSTAVAEAQYGPIDLSEAFVYSITKSIDGHPDTDGSWLKFAMQVAAEYGSPLESTWPYRDNREFLRQRPSAAAFAEARKYRSNPPQAIALVPKDVDQIRATIADERAVAVSLPIFRSSYASLRFHSEGRFLMKLGIFDGVAGWHAMCVVAYVDNNHLARHGFAEELGGGAFLVRNSWGTHWAKDNPLAAHLSAGPGYAIVPYGYVAAYCFEAFTLPAVANRLEPAAWVAKRLTNVGHEWWSRTRHAIVADARQRLSSLDRS
jgi:hypothetical protein